MTKTTVRWVGGLAAVALGSMLALAGCADAMRGGASMEDKGMMKGDKEMMDKGMMKDDKGTMEKK